MTTEMILKTDDRAAKYVTDISGWVDRKGLFWGANEEQARWSGCTHIKCDKCGTIRERLNYCRPCHDNKMIEKFNALEKRDWDGETPLHLDNADYYFFDKGDLLDYIEENEAELSELRLVLCKPVKMRTIDQDILLDDLHEDAELPDSVETALTALNTAILEAEIITWGPDKYQAIVKL